jgi:hypothetical protein
MDKVPLQMSVSDFFNNFAIHAGAHSLEKFFQERGKAEQSRMDCA